MPAEDHEEEVRSAVSELLRDHAVDLVLVAAKCAELAPDPSELPVYPPLEQLSRVVVTKPAPKAVSDVMETSVAAWQSADWLVDL